MAERRPRRWAGILAVVIALGVLAGAAEFALRLIIPGVIENAVRDQLRLTDDHPVEVSLGGSALLNAVRGGVGDVTVTIPDAPILEGIELEASAHADFSPFDPQRGEISGGTATLTVPKEQLGPVVEMLTSGVAQTGEVSDGELVVGRSVDILGQQVPLTASLGLAVANGDIEIEPRGVSAAGFDLDAEQIAQATGSLLDPILSPHTVCVRDRLPAGIELTDIALSSTGSATISARLAPDIFSDPTRLEPGSCG